MEETMKERIDKRQSVSDTHTMRMGKIKGAGKSLTYIQNRRKKKEGTKRQGQTNE